MVVRRPPGGQRQARSQDPGQAMLHGPEAELQVSRVPRVVLWAHFSMHMQQRLLGIRNADR